MLLYSVSFRRWLLRTRRPALSRKEAAVIERLEYLRLRRRKLRVYLADPEGRYNSLLALYAAFLQQYRPNLGLLLVSPRKLPLTKRNPPARGLLKAAPRIGGPFSAPNYAATANWRSAADLREQPLRAGAILMLGADRYKPRHYLWASHLTDVRRALLPFLPNRPEAFVIITGDPNPRRRTSFAYFFKEAASDPEGVWFALDPGQNPLPIPLNPATRRNVKPSPRRTAAAKAARPRCSPVCCVAPPTIIHSSLSILHCT